MSQDVKPDFFDRAQQFFRDYAWVIVRNVIGWALVIASLPVGMLFPGPGGLPVFLIGFALVTFPGKRKLTARFLRGRRFEIEDRFYLITAAFVSIAVPGAILWWIAVSWRASDEVRRIIEQYAPKNWVRVLTVLLAITIVWAVTRLSLKILNGLLLLLPKFRRRFRPWLRAKGLKLLPPRRKSSKQPLPEDEILELAPRHQHRIRETWKFVKPWLRRTAAVVITAWIIMIMVRPLRQSWAQVKEQIAALSVLRFLGASAMFAIFLLVFRAMSWRKALKGFGYRLPHRAAARIWSVSELARYLPGAIWQVVGRVYLCKPYDIPKEIVVTSQILEVCIFLLANVLVAGSCLLWFAQKMMASSDGRPWLITALSLVPLLVLLLHPRIFYTAVNYVLQRMGKSTIVKRLRGRKLIGLLFWMMLGLLWQSLAVYILVDPVLPELKLAWWWVVAGAYALAWIAGFLAFWAPGGIGVRELVFVATMQAILPPQIRRHFENPAELAGLLVLIGFILRLWTVVGELMLTSVAYVWDWKFVTGSKPARPASTAKQPPATAPM